MRDRAASIRYTSVTMPQTTEPTSPVDVADERSKPEGPARRRYKLTIAYDGSEFHGWQKQEPPGLEPLRTVAGVVEATLIRVLGQPIVLVGASRTDAGVHALGQVAHFDAACRIPLERLPDAINARLSHDVEIVTAEVVPDHFDAIRHAVNKQYRYRIFSTHRRPLSLRRYVHHHWMPINPALMSDAAKRLVGTHDFAAFAAAGHNRETTVRTVFDCRVETTNRPEVHIVVSGSGFLYNMVRIIAGTLIEVGRGRLSAETIDAALKSGDRRLAGPTLPPEGLWLEWIKHEIPIEPDLPRMPRDVNAPSA